MRKAAPKKKAQVLGPAPGYYDPEQIRQREEIIAITERDAEWKCEGFADMVVRLGARAVGPPDYNGKPRSWQEIGRKLFGEQRFNTYLRAAIERKRSAQEVSTMGR